MRKRYLRLLTMFLTTCTVLFSVPLAVSAQDAGTTPPSTSGDSTTGGTTNPDQSGGTDNTPSTTPTTPDTSTQPEEITLSPSMSLPKEIGICTGGCNGHVIKGNLGSPQYESVSSIIKVTGGTHKITLSGATINIPDDKSIHAFELGDNNVVVNLTLDGGTTNTLTSGGSRAGLFVPPGATLNIDGSGTLNATGSFGAAGIGGEGYYGSSGTININCPNGKIVARGGNAGAGIGGGIYGSSGNISIKAGTVEAYGGNGITTQDENGTSINLNGGSGIGCGGSFPREGDGGEIVLSGGTVTALGGINPNNSLTPESYGVSGKSLSSDGGSVVLTTNNSTGSISGNMANFNGIIWNRDKKKAQVYGDAILSHGVLNGQSIFIPSGCTLSIPDNVGTLQNEGTVSGGGTLINAPQLLPGNGGTLLIDSSNLKVALSAVDITLTTPLTYDGTDLLKTKSPIKINKTRTEKNNVTYSVDTTGWELKIQKNQDQGYKSEIIDRGTYSILYTRQYFSNVIPKQRAIEVKPKEITSKMVTITDQLYTGEAIEPDVVVKYNNKTLEEGVHYDITGYKDNIEVGKGTVSLRAVSSSNFTGDPEIPFNIVAATLADAKITLDGPDTVPYNGKEQKPKITVTTIEDNGTEDDDSDADNSSEKILDPEKDYDITYSSEDFTNANEIEIKITGKGNYAKEPALTQTYKIEKLPLDITKLAAKDRKYDGTTDVAIDNSSIEYSGLASTDKASEVIFASTGTIESPNVNDGEDGGYTTVKFKELKLDETKGKGKNYYIKSPLPDTDVVLTSPVKISQADAPEKPSLDGKYTVSETPDKFIYTLEVKNPMDGALYEYRMDSKDLAENEGWQDSPVFDNIEPESVHLFEARSKLDPNVKQSEIGEKEVTFELLEETTKPPAITLTFSPNRDEQTFTGTISSDSKLDNVEYFIGKTGVEPKDEDYQSGDGAQLKTDCESNTEYTAYVRFKQTKTHKPSEPTTAVNSTTRLVAKPPIITPEDGTEFYDAQEVTITHKLDGMTIYYTTDGTEPTLESPIYTEPFEITETTTIKAFASKNNMDDSEVATATLTLKLLDVEKPIIEPEGESEFTGSKLVEISCNTEDATIYYTTDGTDPTTESKKYTEPFRISTTTVVKAFAVKEGLNDSEIATATLNKSESTINVHAFLNPFITAGEGVETNPISDELMSKLETTDKAVATESIYQTMTQELSVIGNHGDFTYLKMNFYDLAVKVKIDSDPLRDATLDDFAEGGYTITVPYPDGTSLEANDFAIAHMVASGEKTGNVETWYADKITKTPYGLQFNITSASPLAIAWTTAVPGGPNSNNVGDGDNVVDPGGDDPGDDPNGDAPNGDDPNGDTPADGDNPGDDNGIVTTNPKAGADGAQATGTSAGSGSVADAVKSALSSIMPKTGDTNKIIAWVVVLAASIAVIVGLRIRSKKGNTKGKAKTKKH